MSSVLKSRKVIILFLAFTLIFSALVWVLTLHATQGGRIAGRIYGYGIMWCPALAAWVVCRLTGRSISSLGWQWGATRDMAACYFIPLLYALFAYGIIWLTGWGGFYNEEFVTQTARELGWEQLPAWLFIVAYFVAQAVVGLFGSMATALGEEIGWRGFLVPELSKLMGYTGISITSGVIWAVWHYPLLIFGQYNNGTPSWYGLLCFTVMVVSGSFIYTWYRLKSGSLWTGVMLHASHNLFIQSFFTPMTFDTGNTAWYTDEFGAVMPAVSLLLAIYFWAQHRKLVISAV